MKDYYKILGVSKAATGTEIKKAFRKKALLIHPDKSGNDTKEEFIDLFEAYEVLIDKRRRTKYDKLYDLFFTDTTELKDEELKSDIRRISEKGHIYAKDFRRFDREILGLILLELFFDPSYVLFASCTSIIFGVWTIIKGLTSLEWDYSLVGVVLTVIGLVLARFKIVEIQKTAR